MEVRLQGRWSVQVLENSIDKNGEKEHFMDVIESTFDYPVVAITLLSASITL